MKDWNHTAPQGNYSGSSHGCAYMLPCGYCKELGRQCPQQSVTIQYGSDSGYTTTSAFNEKGEEH